MTGTGSVGRDALLAWLDRTLEPARFADYCPNGLQVEGRAEIRRLVTGVTASATLIREAVAAGADALLVHHGYFWKGEDARLVGMKGARIGALMRANLNLFAYHLPLDAHPVLGNNAQLGHRLGLRVDARGGEHDLVCAHDLATPLDAASLRQRVARGLNRMPLVVGGAGAPISRIAWCTGGAQDAIGQAHAMGAQAYISGEISERTTHLARELGVLYLAAGHHATERYGVQALGERIAHEFGIGHRFIDDPNPA
ncbi:MAG: Nif3-like dinuclear metal center hexameric protein [Burkholderiaceae bacterium]